jgi:alpha-methylacyl-CoA racemase
MLNQMSAKTTTPKPLRPLKGVRVLSLALNLPGPAALMRLVQLGATCAKIEPPSGDQMQHYSQSAYAQLHQGVKVRSADAKSDKGMAIIHTELAKADVLITSFRPSALVKLGLGWQSLHKLYPALCQISIVGACGERAEEPGHDLTYQAEHGLVTGQNLPATLYADMGGSLAATEAVLAALRQRDQSKAGKGIHLEVGLAESAGYLALPRVWGMTVPKGMVGGLHAGYQVFACKDGRVALAALEPHFAKRLCDAAGVADSSLKSMTSAKTTEAVAKFLAGQTRKALDKLAVEKDIPLHSLPKA